MKDQPSLLERRFPYATEAKEIIAKRIIEKLDWNEQRGELKAERFRELWKVRRQPGGRYQITRDYSLQWKDELDGLIEGSLSGIYRVKFNEVEGKLTTYLELTKIEGPTGENLLGAGGNKCCFSGACVGCPQNRA